MLLLCLHINANEDRRWDIEHSINHILRPGHGGRVSFYMLGQAISWSIEQGQFVARVFEMHRCEATGKAMPVHACPKMANGALARLVVDFT